MPKDVNTDDVPNNITGTLGSNLPPSTPSDPWHLAYSEIKSMTVKLRSMSQRMSQLDKIEKDVGSLKNQIEGISAKTKSLESALQNHSTDITSVKSSLSDITSDIKQQDASLEKLWAFTEEVASNTNQRVCKIKHAIQDNIDKIAQIGDVKAIINKEVTEQIRDNINKEVSAQIQIALQAFKQEFKKECVKQMRRCTHATKNELYNIINRNTHNFAYKNLQDQAFFNRHNLIIWGIREHKRNSAFKQATNFFNSKLNLPNLSIDVAYRLGKPPLQGSSYNRPIVVKFARIADRNTVWKKRNDIPQQGKAKSIFIQADLQILYRVLNAAQKTNQYQTAEVKNYKLYLDGSEYSAWELEEFPTPLWPSTLATKVSDNALVFYSKYSALSNHHPAPFEVRGWSYANTEQFLAYKRAKLSGQKSIIQKALRAQDPVEAKSILISLRSDHQEEWNQEVSTIALEGLQAKFRQNQALGNYLRSTSPLTLGEASTNPRWGTGLALQDDNAIDKSKWNKQGNLLGRLLLRVTNPTRRYLSNKNNYIKPK